VSLRQPPEAGHSGAARKPTYALKELANGELALIGRSSSEPVPSLKIAGSAPDFHLMRFCTRLELGNREVFLCQYPERRSRLTARWFQQKVEAIRRQIGTKIHAFGSRVMM
jgi:hypothetical protein